MAYVHDGYFMLYATVEQCATVCPSETAAEVCHKYTENSNCFSPRENLKYLQIKNVTEIFLCACVSGKTVLVLFLKV